MIQKNQKNNESGPTTGKINDNSGKITENIIDNPSESDGAKKTYPINQYDVADKGPSFTVYIEQIDPNKPLKLLTLKRARIIYW